MWPAAAALRATYPDATPRHKWQIAIANASAASAGFGGSLNRRIRVTIFVICALSAFPLPHTAAFASDGVYVTAGRPDCLPTNSAIPEACAVAITLATLC